MKAIIILLSVIVSIQLIDLYIRYRPKKTFKKPAYEIRKIRDQKYWFVGFEIIKWHYDTPTSGSGVCIFDFYFKKPYEQVYVNGELEVVKTTRNKHLIKKLSKKDREQLIYILKNYKNDNNCGLQFDIKYWLRRRSIDLQRAIRYMARIEEQDVQIFYHYLIKKYT